MTACIAWINLADAATLSAVNPGPDVAGDVDRLKICHPARYHEQTGGEMKIRVDFGADCGVGVIALIGCSVGPAARLQVRAGADAAITAPVFDLTVGDIDPRIGYAVACLPAIVTARYWEVTLADPAAAAVRAGRLFMGPVTEFARGYGYGWSREWVDPSKKDRADGGQIIVWEKPRYRRFVVDFPMLTALEAEEIGLECERLVGVGADVLFIADPAASPLGQSVIWGPFESLGGVSQPRYGVFTKKFAIEERRR